MKQPQVELMRYLREGDFVIGLVQREKDPLTQKAVTARWLHFVRVNGEVFLPFEENKSFGLVVFNAGKSMQALPAYFNMRMDPYNVNIFSRGPANPSQCSSGRMWQVAPDCEVIIDSMIAEDDPVGELLGLPPMRNAYTLASKAYSLEGVRAAVVARMHVYAREAIAPADSKQSSTAQQMAVRTTETYEVLLDEMPRKDIQYASDAQVLFSFGIQVVHRVALLQLLQATYNAAPEWVFCRPNSSPRWFEDIDQVCPIRAN